MGVSHWPKVAVKGSSQVVPRTCPNCLGAADVSLRYCYIRPWDVLRPTRYFQSFRYCAACAPAAEAHLRHRGRTGWLLRFPGLFLVMLAGMAAGMLGLQHLLPGATDAPGGQVLRGVACGGGIAAALLLAGLLIWWSRRAAERGCPRREGQATWGLAAFYTGSPVLNLLGDRKIYRAARPEWLAALVRANPDQVDDATYRQVVGTDRPPRESNRPFAA